MFNIHMFVYHMTRLLGPKECKAILAGYELNSARFTPDGLKAGRCEAIAQVLQSTGSGRISLEVWNKANPMPMETSCWKSSTMQPQWNLHESQGWTYNFELILSCQIVSHGAPFFCTIHVHQPHQATVLVPQFPAAGSNCLQLVWLRPSLVCEDGRHLAKICASWCGSLTWLFCENMEGLCVFNWYHCNWMFSLRAWLSALDM